MTNGITKSKGDSNFDIIRSHVINEEIPLTDKQKVLLLRWSYADELIRRNQLRREGIAKMIVRVFDVKRTVAYQDIVNAENLFASSTPLNKQYRLQLRIEFIEMKINEMYEATRFVEDLDEDEKMAEQEDTFAKISRIKTNEYYFMSAVSLEKVLLGYYKEYRDLAPVRAPKKIVYQFIQNNLPAAPMDIDQALKLDGLDAEDTDIIPDDTDS